MTRGEAFAAMAVLLGSLGVTSGCELQTYNSSSNDEALYGPDDGTITDGNPRFASARTLIIDYCVQCHGAFRNYSEAEWVSNNYVVAGDPAGSTVYNRMRGAGVGGVENMPPTETMSGAELSEIRTWIENIGSGG